MRAAIVASSLLVLSLLCHPAEAGFPNGATTAGAQVAPQFGAPSYGGGGQQPYGTISSGGPAFRLAAAPQRLSSAVRSALPNSQPRGGQFHATQGPASFAARPQMARRQQMNGRPAFAGYAGQQGAPQYRVAQFDGYGAGYGMTPTPHAGGAGAVQGGAILEAPGAVGGQMSSSHVGSGHVTSGPIAGSGTAGAVPGHVHGPGCANGNCPGEIVHSDVLLNSQPDGPPTYQAGPVYQSAPAYQEPVYQTFEGGYGGNYGGYDAAPYYESMGATSWDGGGVLMNACPTWFGGVYGLIMTRDNEEDTYLLGDSGDQRALYLASGEFDTGFAGGIEARVGRTFNCCRWGLEFVYWGLFPDDAFASFDVNLQPVTGNLQTVLDYAYAFDQLGNPITDYTDNLVYARARRREEYHNIEINILSGPLTQLLGGIVGGGGCGGGSCGGGGCGGCGDACGSVGSAVVGYDGGYGGGTYCGTGYPVYDNCGGDAGMYETGCGDGYGQGYYGEGCGNVGCTEPRWIANWLFGVRFFKFNEFVGIDYSSVAPEITGANGEVNHTYDVENNLVGVQLGLDLNYCLTKRLNLDFGSRFGLYGNHANSAQQLSTPDGVAYVNPADQTDFDFAGSETNVAFLGELRAGLGFKVGQHLRFAGGYRAIAVSGVATALGQQVYGRELGAPAKIEDVDSDDSLVLHGAYVGSEFAW